MKKIKNVTAILASAIITLTTFTVNFTSNATTYPSSWDSLFDTIYPDSFSIENSFISIDGASTCYNGCTSNIWFKVKQYYNLDNIKLFFDYNVNKYYFGTTTEDKIFARYALDFIYMNDTNGNFDGIKSPYSSYSNSYLPRIYLTNTDIAGVQDYIACSDIDGNYLNSAGYSSTYSVRVDTVTYSFIPTAATERESVLANAHYGDVNLDGYITTADVILINKYMAGMATLNAQQLENANCVYDNSINNIDGLAIMKYINNIIDELPTR